MSADAALVDVVESGSRVAARWLRAQMATNPSATLGLAALTGYVLGNGLDPSLGGFVIRGASRVMLADVAGAAVRGAWDGPARGTPV